MAFSTPKTYTVGELLTAADMNTYQRDQFDATLPYGTTPQTYTPALTASTTNPNLGSSSNQSGFYYQTGRWVFVEVYIRFGTSPSAGSGTYIVSLPISAYSSFPSSVNPGQAAAVGSGHLRDDSANRAQAVSVQLRSASSVSLIPTETPTATFVTDGTYAWASNDSITFQAQYLAA